MKTLRAMAGCLLAITAATAMAQQDTIVQDKVVTNAKMLGVGATNLLDTYLSPEKYRGTELRYISHTTRNVKAAAGHAR